MIEVKRTTLKEITIRSDNDPTANAKLVIATGTPRAYYGCSDCLDELCVRFATEGDWKCLHINKESVRKLIPLLQEFIED